MSAYIKFHNSEEKYPGTIRPIDAHTIEVTNAPKNISGLCLYNGKNNHIIGDYSAYTYAYRDINATTYQYSDDGHTYMPPIPPTPPATPEPYVPTIAEVKELKIEEIILLYDTVMCSGTSVILSDESQITIPITQELINTVNTAYLSAMTLYDQKDVRIPFEINNTCHSYSPLDIILIYIAIQQHIVYHKSLKNELLATIARLETKEETELISYSVDSLDAVSLIGFHTSIENGNATINAIIDKYGITIKET